MQRKCCFSVILSIPFLLAACAGPQTSVDKNARHMSYQIAQAHFDPNTRPLTVDNTRLMAKFLSQFYELGKKDRAAGLTLAQAQQRVNSFSQAQPGGTAADTPFAAEKQKSYFLTQEYSAEQPEKHSKILKDGAIATYWDGYNGKP